MLGGRTPSEGIWLLLLISIAAATVAAAARVVQGRGELSSAACVDSRCVVVLVISP